MKNGSPLTLKKLSSSELITSAKQAATDERKATCLLIEHLREIDDRLLYLELGFGSLFEFAVKELGLSEGSAHRRISAMKLARDVPEVKEKLESGSITLSNAAKVQVALNSVKKEKMLSLSEKNNLIESCENKSQRECDEMLFEALPELSKEPKITERVKSVSAELIEIKIVISKELNSEIEMLMKLDSHRNPKQSIALLLESLVKEELKREEKKRGKKDESKKEEFKKIKEQSRNSPDIEMKPAAGRTKKLQSELGEDQETFLQEVQNLENHTHDFPTEVKRIVWVRAKGKCEFQNCESSYQLQYDHIKPKALGGTSELENCRLLCRAHNIFVATQAFGREQMGRFVAGMKIAS